MYFVLGAQDPEMIRIEEILKEKDLLFSYATKDGKRCHPGNAYQADRQTFEVSGQVVFVECDLLILGGAEIIHVDHHRPGDPGYGLAPSQYRQASSIGQIYALLNLGELPHEDLILAAMDHSPAHAIRGECPGVSAEEVLERKISEIAAATKHEPSEVREKVSRYDALISTSPEIEVGGQSLRDLRDTYLGEGYSVNLLSAQVAALAGGYAVLLRHRDVAGKPEKWSISGHARPQTIKAFKEEWGPAQGLTGIYGVPERGYAGGYLQA